MANEWRHSTWGDEISLEYGKGLRDYKDAVGPYRVYGANGPVGWTTSSLASGPGVILGRKGACRGVEYSKEPFFVIDTAYYVKPKNELNMRWLYYAIKHYKLGEIDDGSPIPSTTRSAVYVRELQVPPIEQQRHIADVLGKLDDKIELNRRMNRTLERMAAAIFKSWFINFDPVRAKAEGRDPTSGGLPADIADLFPNCFEDSALGPIPTGWEAGVVGDMAEQAIGGQWGSDSQDEGTVPAICLRGCDMEDLRASGFAPKAPTRFVKANAINKRLPSERDILIAASGAGPCGRPLWCVNRISELYTHPVIYSNFVKRFTTPSPAHAVYLDRSLIRKFNDRTIHDYINGTSVPNLDAPGLLSTCKLLVPPHDVLQAFFDFCQPGFQRLYARQNVVLARLRDTLLPKLLSGEIELPNAESIAEEIA